MLITHWPLKSLLALMALTMLLPVAYRAAAQEAACAQDCKKTCCPTDREQPLAWTKACAGSDVQVFQYQAGKRVARLTLTPCDHPEKRLALQIEVQAGADRGVPMLTKLPYVSRLFKNTGKAIDHLGQVDLCVDCLQTNVQSVQPTATCDSSKTAVCALPPFDPAMKHPFSVAWQVTSNTKCCADGKQACAVHGTAAPRVHGTTTATATLKQKPAKGSYAVGVVAKAQAQPSTSAAKDSAVCPSPVAKATAKPTATYVIRSNGCEGNCCKCPTGATVKRLAVTPQHLAWFAAPPMPPLTAAVLHPHQTEKQLTDAKTHVARLEAELAAERRMADERREMQETVLAARQEAMHVQLSMVKELVDARVARAELEARLDHAESQRDMLTKMAEAAVVNTKLKAELAMHHRHPEPHHVSDPSDTAALIVSLEKLRSQNEALHARIDQLERQLQDIHAAAATRPTRSPVEKR